MESIQGSVVPDSEVVFLEQHLRDFLAQDLSALGPLKLVGVEHPVPFGRIDILASDPNGFVVIELKRGVAGRDAVGQLQSYMGAVCEANPNVLVRGVLVAADLDSAAASALRVATDISFVAFKASLRFEFEEPEYRSFQPAQAKPPARRARMQSAVVIFCNKCQKSSRAIKVGQDYLCATCSGRVG